MIGLNDVTDLNDVGDMHDYIALNHVRDLNDVNDGSGIAQCLERRTRD